MESVVVDSVVSKITEPLVDSIWRQISYIWNYYNNIQSLKDQVEKLKGERESVQHSVDEARRNGEEIENIINKWMATVDEAIEVADKILQDYDTTNKSCFMGCCPNLKTRHQLGRKASKEITVVAEVLGDGKFGKISYRIPPVLGPAKDYESFESRTLDADVDLSGVYGLSGVGKTTLAKKVAEQVKDDGIFEAVVLASVTQNVDLNRIQQEIAERLSLKFNVESIEVRAARLCARLKQGEKILVILYDIWERIKLEEIGIPSDSDHKGCKIMVTSRNQNVLWEMGAQRDFRLEVLEGEDGWHLFEKKVGTVEIARRCAGLPVLIAVVATALINKELFEWNDALEELKKFNNLGIEARVYSALEFSDNFLGEEEKSLFLLCGQLSHLCTINDLLKYSMVVNDLKRSCLLLEEDQDKLVKMHDVVRSFAASVAAKHHPVLTLAYHTVLEECPEKEFFEQCASISLRHSKIPELPQVFGCPNLKLFLFLNDDPLLKIPENLFSRMVEVKVLDLTRMNLSPLPSSLQFLENLQTLCLDFCVLEDIAIIGELKKLQVLSLIGSSIFRLPSDIRKLTRLLEVIPSGVLSCLIQLEDLYMGNSFVQWEGEGHDSRRNNANLVELKLLSNLVSLDLKIIDAKIIPRNLFSKMLERWTILIGNEWDWSSNYKTSRIWKLKLNTSIELEKVKVLLMRAEDLYVDDLKYLKNVLYELDGQGFPQPGHLCVQNSVEIEYVVDGMRMGQLIAFPRLESLLLDNLNGLDKICHGPIMLGSFSNLRKLNVRNCNVLKNLFLFLIFRGLVQLEEINASSCKILETIVDEESENDNVRDEGIKLTQLCKLTLEYLPHFTSFCSQIQFPNLTDLKLSSINVGKIWPNKLIGLSSCIERLTTLIIDGCGHLSYLFTSSMVGSLAQLKKLEICDCKSMEVVIIKEEGEMMSKMLFPKLDTLKMKGLPKFIRFCIGNLIECPSMRVLWIENCPHLQTFISSSITKNLGITSGAGQASATLFDEKVCFPNLEELHILYMHKLKMMWYDELQADSFCTLKVLEVQHMKELLKIFPSKLLRRFLQNLKSLIVSKSNLVEEVFDLQELIKAKETNAVATTQLRTLGVKYLPKLKHLWNGDPHGILSFHNLHKVHVWFCPSLTSVFPFSIAHNLSYLTVDIDGCGMEELVAKEERIETAPTPKFVFSQLKSLRLWRSKIKCFYSEKHIIECTQLEKLSVHRCDKLEVFTSEPQDLQGTHMEKQKSELKIQVLQPLFSFRKIIHNLEELTLNQKDITMIQQGQFPVDLFQKLKILHLQYFDDASLNSPFHLLQKFQNLETLVLRRCYFKELLSYGIKGQDAGVLSQIRFLRLEFLPNIRKIWNQECQPGQVLENLQTLEIVTCYGLTNLAPSSASFQNLMTLDVWRCAGLVNLISSSTAKSMVNLTKMSVRESKMVEEIVSSEGDESHSQSEIIFSKLGSLKLYCLTSLNSFCSLASCTIKFPSLE
ncbi:hypothetical protein P3X46_024877 [Hevea brasiliensis]|uniref:AAA+ ATPase domain-containing protein n=1 Tax=Hevea brasiliensis TaxID=3981 RepID=A0ABQ9L4X7_HEVBR|nr:hypothetical protein P3X46_024877 [Hevea brasiliensis]